MITAKLVYPFTETWIDYPDDESLALVVHYLGCEHGCVKCINPRLQKIDADGEGIISFTLLGFSKALAKDLYLSKTNKVVLSGGDPLHPNNIQFTRLMLFNLGDIVDFTIYTGYEIEYIKANNITGFSFLKCGKYIEDLKQPSEKTDEYLQWSSSNQCLYDFKFNLLSKDGRYYFER